MISKRIFFPAINLVSTYKVKTQKLCVYLALATMAGCSTWVPLTSGGKQVDLRIASGVESCQRIGSLTVNGVEKIGFIPRGKTKVQTELSNQARNDAAVMGANVVVPDGGVKKGRRSFIAYRCP